MSVATPPALDLAGLVGEQRPRVLCAPDSVSSAGQEAVELAASVGLLLDPWQRLILELGCGEQADGRWSAFEVGMIVSRQNGKGAVFEARELAGLFLFDEQLILHSAHEFKTAEEHFRRLLALIEGSDDLRKRVKRVTKSHGNEGIELTTGQRIRFVARSTGSGRGFSGQLNVLDEAYNLPDAAVDALMPTMSAQRNPQMWYGSSAGDVDLAPCDQLARVRRRGLAGESAGLVYAEWSAVLHTQDCTPSCTEHDNPADPGVWARTNPGLGIRISPEHVAREYASMSARGFSRERLGVGNWPVLQSAGWRVITEDAWRALASESSAPGDPVAFAVDVAPDRRSSAIGVAGPHRDLAGVLHAEVIDHRPGTGWVVDRAKTLQERWSPCRWVIDKAGPAASLTPALIAAGLDITESGPRDMAQACGQIYDAVMQGALRHLDQPVLAVALANADKRPLGDAWAWARGNPDADIAPLVAVTLAAWGYTTRPLEPEHTEPWGFFG